MSSLDYLDLCRLCLVKDRASVPIFEGEGDVRQIFLKIAACLPVKVVRGDKLPKKICDDCVYKVEQFYQFWNTTANVEKQLLQWLGDVGMEDKQAYVSGVLNPDQSVEGRLNANVIQQTDEHQNNMGMNMMDTMNLDMPMMMQTEQSQMTTMNSNDTNVQTIQAVPGTSVRPPQQERRKDDEDESSEDEDNSDDECDADEGLSVKEETEETANRTIEPTFVNVSLPCDEAGPSGLQQQKINEMSDMVMAQSTDGDPKSGLNHVIEENPISHREDLDLTFSEDSNASDPETYSTIFRVERDALYHCNSCGEGFPNEVSLLSHQTVNDCIQDNSNISKERQSLISNNNSIDLNIKELRMSSSLGPLKCQFCQKVFKKKKYLRVHTALHRKSHVCHICSAKLTSEYYLNLHMRRHKSDIAEFCPICKKGFYLKNNLKNHMKIHVNEKSYTCGFCHKSFGNQIYLKSHMKTHDHAELKKKYKCPECKFETFYSYCYKEHMWTHSGESQLPCQYCGKVLQRSYMKIHVRIHTGEKPDICEFCGKGFGARKYLVKHRRVHTGERPFQCHACDKKYTQRSSLTAHFRTHHDERLN